MYRKRQQKSRRLSKGMFTNVGNLICCNFVILDHTIAVPTSVLNCSVYFFNVKFQHFKYKYIYKLKIPDKKL
jgi:hypothetical protein